MSKSNGFSDSQIEKLGYIAYRNFGKHFTAMQPMDFSRGRIIYAEDLEGVLCAWWYKSMDSALLELYLWTPSENSLEPNGWFKSSFALASIHEN